MKMKQWLVALILSLAAPLSFSADPVWLKGKNEQGYDIKVYRAESCGCCKGWIDHLKDHNFNVEDVVVTDLDKIKRQYGVPPQAASCHTAVVNGKVIEGHVPAQEIKSLLSAKNDIRLLAVPGMPSGGPGMDLEGARKDAFRVFAQTKSGVVSIYRDYQSY